MPDISLPSIFFSYSRQDSTFVDRLEADFRARGFRTWVDRRMLEGGQEWEREIEAAIDRCSLMVLILSPAAVESRWVKKEYEYALAQRKGIVPVGFQPCTAPEAVVAKFQTVSWPPEYESGLKKLINTILHPQIVGDVRDLYQQSRDARQRGDLEFAALLLERILDREPDHSTGLAAIAAGDLHTLSEQVYQQRALRLRQDAQEARRDGEYGREAGALQALIALGKPDRWAEEYLPIARTNQQFLDLYAVIRVIANEGNAEEARTKLSRLWADAPFYGDPAGLAPALGLAVPPSYEEWKARNEAQKKLAQVQAHVSSQIGRANATATQQRDSATKLANKQDAQRLKQADSALSEAIARLENEHADWTRASSMVKARSSIRQVIDGNNHDVMFAVALRRWSTTTPTMPTFLQGIISDVEPVYAKMDELQRKIREQEDKQKSEEANGYDCLPLLVAYVFSALLSGGLIYLTLPFIKFIMSFLVRSSDPAGAFGFVIFVGIVLVGPTFGVPAILGIARGVRGAAISAQLKPVRVQLLKAESEFRKLDDANEARFRKWYEAGEREHNAQMQQLEEDHQRSVDAVDAERSKQLKLIDETYEQRTADIGSAISPWPDQLQRISDQWLHEIEDAFKRWRVPVGDEEIGQLAQMRDRYAGSFDAIATEAEHTLATIAQRYAEN